MYMRHKLSGYGFRNNKKKKEKNPWKLKYIEMKNVSSISVPLIRS